MNLLIIDTETTGLDPINDQMIELGAILYSVPHQTSLHQVSTLIPACHNPQEKVNRIPSKALPDVSSHLQKIAFEMFLEMVKHADYAVAHNADFDAQWFEKGFLERDGHPLKWLCTMSDFEFPLQTRPGESLISVALAHGIGVSSAHRALTDCLLIAALFDRLNDLPELIAHATRLKTVYIAKISYDDRQLAKDVGFKWNPDRKIWFRKMAREDIEKLPFKVVEDALSPSIS